MVVMVTRVVMMVVRYHCQHTTQCAAPSSPSSTPQVSSVRLAHAEEPPPQPEGSGLNEGLLVGTALVGMLLLFCALARSCGRPSHATRLSDASVELRPAGATVPQRSSTPAAKQIERASLLRATGFDSQPASPPPEVQAAMQTPANGAEATGAWVASSVERMKLPAARDVEEEEAGAPRWILGVPDCDSVLGLQPPAG